MSPELALQKAVIDTLRADAGVAALISGRVHDEPPADPVYPYVVLTRAEVRPWGGLDAEGTEHALTLLVTSRFGGSEEAKAVIAALRGALHGVALTLDGGWRCVNLRATYADTFRSSDWRSTLGVARLRAVVEPL